MCTKPTLEHQSTTRSRTVCVSHLLLLELRFALLFDDAVQTLEIIQSWWVWLVPPLAATANGSFPCFMALPPVCFEHPTATLRHLRGRIWQSRTAKPYTVHLPQAAEAGRQAHCRRCLVPTPPVVHLRRTISFHAFRRSTDKCSIDRFRCRRYTVQPLEEGLDSEKAPTVLCPHKGGGIGRL